MDRVKWEELLKKTHCDKCGEIVNKGEGIIAFQGLYHIDTCYKEKREEFVNNYEWDEYKTFNEDHIICPYCGNVDEDSWEYSDDEGEIDCGRCGREFNYTRDIAVKYTTTPKKD